MRIVFEYRFLSITAGRLHNRQGDPASYQIADLTPPKGTAFPLTPCSGIPESRRLPDGSFQSFRFLWNRSPDASTKNRRWSFRCHPQMSGERSLNGFLIWLSQGGGLGFRHIRFSQNRRAVDSVWWAKQKRSTFSADRFCFTHHLHRILCQKSCYQKLLLR